MPLYEYQCANCSKVHEIIQKFSDPALTECPDCRGALTKLMSMNSFALKGGGWYTTDYKRSGKSSTASDSSSAAPACGPSGCGAGACET
jgi:putative FmdB family regulatory protein